MWLKTYILSWIEIPPTPHNLKPLIRHFDQEETYEGKGKKCQITPDHNDKDTIFLGLAVATEEQIWNKVDVALMETLDDPMARGCHMFKLPYRDG